MIEVSAVIVIALISCNNAFFGPRHSSHLEETYVLENTAEYIFVNQKSAWLESKFVCESHYAGNLAIVNTNEIAEFLAQAIADTDIIFEGIWIGARRENSMTNFVWITNVGVLTTSLLQQRDPSESLQNVLDRNCLSFTRLFHNKYSFVDLECHIPRPFVCERPIGALRKEDDLTIPAWVTIGDFKYGTFNSKKTWREAVNSCRMRHAHLASFRNINETNLVGKHMLIGRPSLHKAWIGGILTYGGWNFINGHSIPSTTDTESGFPPWAYLQTTNPIGCLTLDRHSTDIPVFLEEDCSATFGYICTKDLRGTPDFKVVIANGIGYVIHYIPKSWEVAQLRCNTHKGQLAIVAENNLHDIIAIMGENQKEVFHAWVGGRLHDSGEYFYWVKTNATVQSDLFHRPPWPSQLYDFKYQCLNMDRENHNQPIVYGVACHVRQEFICEQSDLDSLPLPFEEIKKMKNQMKLGQRSRSGNLGKQEPEEDDGINFIN